MEEKGFDVNKEENFTDWYFELLKVADVIDQRYPVKGFMVHKEIAAIAEREMYRVYTKELDRTGHKVMKFPSVIPESAFEKEKEHVEGFEPEVFWITHGGKEELQERLGLRPTSEVAMYTMYAQWIRSWRDLPLKVYQECQVWRYETKHTRPLLRDREFHWIEAHDVFATEDEARKQVMEDIEMTEKVLHKEFGLPQLTFRRPEWDKFAGAVDTFAADILMPNGLVIQQPSTHYLGTNFSKPYDVKFTDEQGKEHFAHQTCYGPCISRLLSSVIMVHGDNKGMKFPWKIAPYQVVIIPIYNSDENKNKVLKRCKEIMNNLRDQDTRVELDDSDKRPGAKYYHWELRGACLRFEIGMKEVDEGHVTIVRRDNASKRTVTMHELDNYLKLVPKEIQSHLIKEADTNLDKRIHEVDSLEQLKKTVESGGFSRIMMCSRDMKGENCADRIREETVGGEVRGTLHGKDERPRGNCLVCGNEAKEVVYVAKAY